MSQQESVVPTWRKSSRCDANNCVEVAQLERAVAVRDNARPGVHLTFDRDSWQGLLREIRSDRLGR